MARVVVAQATHGEIAHGILAFIGVERGDDAAQAARLAQRILGYRIFADAQGKMNLNVAAIQGGVLLVPQFTLAADTHQGTRASFTPAAPPEQGQRLFETLVEHIKLQHAPVATGVFGADMQVHLINDGPVTFWLRVTANSATGAE